MPISRPGLISHVDDADHPPLPILGVLAAVLCGVDVEILFQWHTTQHVRRPLDRGTPGAVDSPAIMAAWPWLLRR